MSLAERLAAEIRQSGPMTVAQFMTACLHDPRDGYYAARPALGAGGDFITAPLVSQIFGELIGLWMASAWQALGAPQRFVLVEMGPGDGTLMSDLLRGPKDGAVVLTGLNNLQVVRTAIVSGVAAVVLVRGKQPEQETIALAREHDLPLLSTPFTMYTACGRLFRAGLRGLEHKTRE